MASSDTDSDALSASKSTSNETTDRQSSSPANTEDIDCPERPKRRAARNFEARLKERTIRNLV